MPKTQLIRVTAYGGGEQHAVEVEVPEALSNGAGSVKGAEQGHPKIHLTPDARMRAAGVTKLDAVGPYPEEVVRDGVRAIKVRSNKGPVLVGLDSRPDVRELIENAQAIAAAAARGRQSVFRRDRDADAELVRQMREREAELVRQIPADHERVRFHQTGSADGDPVGDYRTESGEVIPWDHPDLVIHGHASATRPGALASFAHEVVASIPRAAVERVRAGRRAEEQGRADREAAEGRRVADLAAVARATGRPQLVRTWTEAVDEEDNSLNVVEEYVHPDGSTRRRTTPTH